MSTIIERLFQDSPDRDPHVSDPHANNQPIGKILLDAGKLNAVDAERALRLAKDDGIRFGEACIQLRLVSRADVDSALSRQFDFPYLRPDQTDLSNELVAAYNPFGPQVEALRALRTQLLLRWFNLDRRILAIVSPTRGDGRSYLAANLAIVFSQLGERTLLIDADMRCPRQHVLFRLGNRYGLSAALAGRANGAAIESVGGFANLSIIPSGATPPNPLELVSRPEFKDLLFNEARGFDVVLIDTPAADRASDSQAITARAGGALIVAREGKSRLESLGRLANSIQNTSADVVGSVLNRF